VEKDEFPGGRITLSYDSLDRRSTSKDTSGAMLTYSYDAANNRTAVQDTFGSTTTWTYDVLNRAATMTFSGTGMPALREDFAYTVRDQVAKQTRYSNLAGTTVVGSSTMAYDSVRGRGFRRA